MPSDVTQLLHAIDSGDAKAAEELLPIIYDELRQMAAGKMARENPQTLQATALVHEAWMRIGERQFENRDHFFAAAAEAMRRILVEKARRRGRIKRGAELERADYHESKIVGPVVSSIP